MKSSRSVSHVMFHLCPYHQGFDDGNRDGPWNIGDF
jgi:hypothetical protein